MNAFTYADPATPRGRLQRGRGLGARLVRSTPDAADLVYECVLSDSRWDRQAESRDSYLARLVHRLDLPLAPVGVSCEGTVGMPSNVMVLSFLTVRVVMSSMEVSKGARWLLLPADQGRSRRPSRAP
ncbi:hypothetical protein [Kitasatospora sp. NPDC085464]|uniref:hypothetical protein n=1 Tax=Kitasatospora sp. NPDC085464 TaxID=3364063 RepID=UPI0037CA9416